MTVIRETHRVPHPARYALRDAGISVEEVAGLAMTTCGTVRAQLDGRSPVSEMVRLAVCELLDREPIDLFFPDEDADSDLLLPTAQIIVQHPNRKPEQIMLRGETVTQLLEWLDK